MFHIPPKPTTAAPHSRPPALRSLAQTGLVIALGVLLSLAAGCSRDQYRRQADCEVYGLIGCGSTDPRWPLDNYTIEPDPRSRFSDP
ncbi:hypothetical protein ACFL5Q_06070, partial [Planctomycetota bacterium]